MSTTKLIGFIVATSITMVIAFFALRVYTSPVPKSAEEKVTFSNSIQKNMSYSTIIASQGTLQVTVVDTLELRAKGLSGTVVLPRDQGLFFAFDTSEYWHIWMKDMLFSIDIIWLDEMYKVVHIEHNISPDTYPKTFPPTSPARFVLEVNAGVAKDLGIKIGDTLKFEKNNLREE